MSMSFVEVFLSMDNAARVVDVAWTDFYFFKIDHKNGDQHVPTYEDSRKFFGCFFGQNFNSVFAVRPFGWKSSPLVYHSLTEALAMYCHLW